MQIEKKLSAIEAVLFASGDAIEDDRLCEAVNIERETLPKLIVLLNDRYESSLSSLKVLKLDNSYQLTTLPEYSQYIKAALETKRTAALTPAAMEVLTIVAYNQPVTKSFVEHVRGVESSGIVNSLVEKDLLEEAGRLDVPGKPVAYKTTNTFLRCFGISSLDELPPLSNRNEQVRIDEIQPDSDFENDEEAIEDENLLKI